MTCFKGLLRQSGKLHICDPEIRRILSLEYDVMWSPERTYLQLHVCFLIPVFYRNQSDTADCCISYCGRISATVPFTPPL